MKKMIYNRLKVLKKVLEASSEVGAKHPTNVGEIREGHFRSFLMIFFPMMMHLKEVFLVRVVILFLLTQSLISKVVTSW